MWISSWHAIEHTAVIAVTGFIAVVAMVRISGNRTLARMNAFDFIVSVSMGSILGRAILTPAVSLMQLVVGVALLLTMQALVAALGVRSHRFYALATPPPKTLYEAGTFHVDVMRRAGVGVEEMEAAVRETGLHGIAEVDRIVLETQGQLSVVWRPYVPTQHRGEYEKTGRMT
jgi:uncharacterized membrane protein YcaP (DUF421 family)